MAEKAKHAFGSLENIDQALANGTIDSYDILFVKNAEGKPYVGWVDKDGNKVVVSNDEEIAELETALATKISADEVDTKIEGAVTEKVETVVETVVTERVETIVTEKVETVVNEKVDTQVETIVEEKVDEAMDVKIEEAVAAAKEYTNSKIAEIEEAASYEIIEF
jgi:hypothetical protein